ncbi:unnamed protein product [Brachionus calyciflorus]|uniref:Peptidase S1 domain-containing protein n=1 Tax=Brachionus calyciflorus TaxID=104777 RepID=A0A813MNV5_9BILA|nr:unnamed protein product [Brachionus calyciflorus]
MFFYFEIFLVFLISNVYSNVLESALRGIPGVANLAYQHSNYYVMPKPTYRSYPYQSYSYNPQNPFFQQPLQQPSTYYNQPPSRDFKPQYPKFKSNSDDIRMNFNEDIYGQCGYIAPRVTKYVANGDDTESKLWPWYVQIVIAGNNRSESETFCGGTIIHKKYVLTAAHCYDDLLPSKRSRNTVVLAKGINNIIPRVRNGKKSDNIVKIRVKDVTLHPEYIPAMTESEARRKGVTPGPLHDLAIIELRHESSDVYEQVIPVCLPSENYDIKANTQCKIMGHGFMSANDEDQFIMPNILQSADVRLSTNQECKDGVESASIKSKINSDTLCVKGPVHPCVGDSGGPLLCAGESNSNIKGADELDDYENEQNPDQYEPKRAKWYLCGVTSFAVSTDEHDRCGSYKSAVFGKVSNYIRWIKQVINERI